MSLEDDGMAAVVVEWVGSLQTPVAVFTDPVLASAWAARQAELDPDRVYRIFLAPLDPAVFL